MFFFQIRHFHYTGWPDHAVPPNSRTMIDFLNEIHKCAPIPRKENFPPIVVHCSAGVGRTGALILLDVSICRAKSERVTNFARTWIFELFSWQLVTSGNRHLHWFGEHKKGPHEHGRQQGSVFIRALSIRRIFEFPRHLRKVWPKIFWKNSRIQKIYRLGLSKVTFFNFWKIPISTNQILCRISNSVSYREILNPKSRPNNQLLNYNRTKHRFPEFAGT